MFSTLASPVLPLLHLLLSITAQAHQPGHNQAPAGNNAAGDGSASVGWASVHLAEEHSINNFDPGAFFALHDYDTSGGWTPDEVRRTYGLEDESLVGVSEAKRQEVTREVFRLFDVDRNGVVEREEWMGRCKDGVRLPDFGLGPGHHGDDEYEYEIHHFDKYHDENTKEEDLIHPEDIAHFAKHDREEAEAERQERLNQQPVNEANIPHKFRRQP